MQQKENKCKIKSHLLRGNETWLIYYVGLSSRIKWASRLPTRPSCPHVSSSHGVWPHTCWPSVWRRWDPQLNQEKKKREKKKSLWLKQPFPLKWNSGDLSVYAFWFDAHCSSSGIKGTVVGMIIFFSPFDCISSLRSFPFFLCLSFLHLSTHSQS